MPVKMEALSAMTAGSAWGSTTTMSLVVDVEDPEFSQTSYVSRAKMNTPRRWLVTDIQRSLLFGYILIGVLTWAYNTNELAPGIEHENPFVMGLMWPLELAKYAWKCLGKGHSE